MRFIVQIRTAFIAPLTAVALLVGGPSDAGIKVNGTEYDQVGIVTEVTSTAITVQNKTYLLSVSGGIRKGKGAVPVSAIKPGDYVGLRVMQNARGQLMVTGIDILPQ